jgi:hypothetical protein
MGLFHGVAFGLLGPSSVHLFWHSALQEETLDQAGRL